MSSAIYDVYSKVDDGYVVECDHEDLRELNLSGSDLSGDRFIDCDLRESDFHGANLRGVIFIRCDFDKADFSASTLQGVEFTDCEGLDQVDFTGALMDDVDMNGEEVYWYGEEFDDES